MAVSRTHDCLPANEGLGNPHHEHTGGKRHLQWLHVMKFRRFSPFVELSIRRQRQVRHVSVFDNIFSRNLSALSLSPG